MVEIKSERHQKALNYAINQIRLSPLYPYLKELYLFGSCARNEQKWRSDIDLFMQLDDEVVKVEHWKSEMFRLRSFVSSDELYEPECDLKIVLGPEWKENDMLFYKNVRKDGVRLWI